MDRITSVDSCFVGLNHEFLDGREFYSDVGIFAGELGKFFGLIFADGNCYNALQRDLNDGDS